MVLKTLCFASLMTWIIISGLLGNSKIHLVTKIKGCQFMTSTKNDQCFDPHPDCLQKMNNMSIAQKQ